MKKDKNLTKELYNQLRALSWKQLWEVEVPRFDVAPAQERLQRVALVRAIGVVFSESGNPEQKQPVSQWLRGLLQDPCEKIRRYAMAAIPKIGGGATEETELLSLLQKTTGEREKKFLGKALEKIGGAATLDAVACGAASFLAQTEQKIKASLARNQSPSFVRTDTRLSDFKGLRLHLRGRSGLERVVRDEVEEFIKKHGKFRVVDVRSGLVALEPVSSFTLGEIYSLRCFGALGLAVDTVGDASETQFIEALARAITSPLSRRILETFTEGSLRYRLDFVAKGHQRSAVGLLATRAYALCPEILNDPRHARWTLAIHPTARGHSVEWSPKLAPDPRFTYRQQDVPAASHPPLAACMARWAGKIANDIIWDPFCGSGLELIERSLLGGVRKIYATDLSAEALAITEQNIAAANLGAIESKFTCCDFRDFATIQGLAQTATLIITNPPMGKRVPIPNLRGLIEDLFRVASRALRPGGRLVFANPIRMEQSPQPSLKLQLRQTVDFGGFNCSLEKYLKI